MEPDPIILFLIQFSAHPESRAATKGKRSLPIDCFFRDEILANSAADLTPHRMDLQNRTLDVAVEGSQPANGLMEPWGYTAAAVTLCFIGFFGFSLNLVVIYLMCKDVQLWTPMNIILFNLVCSDFSVSILGNPFTLIAAIHHHWIFGDVVCQIYGFFMSLLGTYECRV